MKKYFVKNDKGMLVEASSEQLMDPKIQKYDDQGDIHNAATSAGDETHNDPVKELEGLISDVVGRMGNFDAIKEKTERLESKLAAFEDMQQKGWPLPDQANVAGCKTIDELAELTAPYELGMQGKRLQDKFLHPSHQIDENTRMELAKYYCLMLKAGMSRNPNPADMAEFRKHFGDVTTEVKTVIGDSGNTFPIPDIVDAEIMAFAREKSVILANARIWPMSSEKQSFPVEGTAVSVGWGNTTNESETDINSEFELDAEELSAYSAVRNTTLADSRSDIVSWLTECLGEAAGLEIDNKGFNGVGTDDPFICSGILSAACGNSVVMASGSTAFSNLDADVLSEMISKLDGLRKAGAMFWMNGLILHYVRSLKDTTNRPIFIETVGSPVSGTIWGFPYKEVIKCPSTTAANTAFMAFGNMRYFGVGRRLATGALSVDPWGLWTTNRTRFKLYQRWGLGMALASGFVRLLTAAS